MSEILSYQRAWMGFLQSHVRHMGGQIPCRLEPLRLILCGLDSNLLIGSTNQLLQTVSPHQASDTIPLFPRT